MITDFSALYTKANSQDSFPGRYCASGANSLAWNDPYRRLGRMKMATFLSAVSVIVVIFAFTQQAIAQVAPGAIADANSPSGAPDPQKEDSIWQVDPLTGDLSVKIPFATTPIGGRGPTIPFSLLYNSSSTVTLQTTSTTATGGGFGGGYDGTISCNGLGNCAIVSIGPDMSGASMQITQNYAWLTGPYLTPPGPSGPWTTSGPFIYNSFNQYPNEDFNVGITELNYGAGCSVWGQFMYGDEDGAVHDMNIEYGTFLANPIAGNLLSGPCQLIYNDDTSASGQGIAHDGSGLVSAGNASGSGVLYPDGTQFVPGAQQYTSIPTGGGSTYLLSNLEDTNGNISSFAQDSEGRTPYTTTIPIGMPGQIPAGTYSVTTNDAAGNPESYSVTFSTESIGSFSMPHPSVSTSPSDISAEGDCINDLTCPTGYAVAPPVAGASFPAVTSVGLPNGLKYTFLYGQDEYGNENPYGTLSEIKFPTGGHVRFKYGIRNNETHYSNFAEVSSITVTDVWVSDPITGEDHWSYTFPSAPAGSRTLISSVLAPDNTTTSFTGVPYWTSIFPDVSYATRPSWKAGSEQVVNSKGALVKSVATAYGCGMLPKNIATTLYDGPSPQQMQTNYVYDSWCNVIEKDESDFYGCSGNPCAVSATPPGGWLRMTFTSYAYTSKPSWVTAHIVNKPALVLVTDGNGHPFSLTKYGYDEVAVTAPTGYTGFTQHDDANYAVASTLPRGNLTTESHCTVLNQSASFSAATASSAASACTGNWLSTTHTYDLAGQVMSTTDPNHNTTTFAYDDNCAGGNPAVPTDGYVKQITNPYGNQETYSYYCPSGQIASHTDLNQQPTKYLHNDPNHMSRLSEVQYPDHGDVQMNYVDATPPSTMVTTATGETSGSIVHTTLYDELGRVAQKQLTTDTSGTGYVTDYVTSTYDSLGRLQGVTNPYRTTSDPTYGITSYSYDALGRKIAQCQSDNTVTPSTTCVPTNDYEKWTYSGNAVIFQDEVGNQWERWTNGIGQLAKVLEPNGASSAPSMETDYTYDPLSDLLSVMQCGGPSPCQSTAARSRSFSYDNEARLLTSTNPEQGTVCYGLWSGANCVSGYDPNGNLIHKTDARGVITNYSYDFLNRVLSKTYSHDPSNTPFSCYQYGTSLTGNTIGRLINEWTQSASAGSPAGTCAAIAPGTGFWAMRSILAYDPMGRIWNEQQLAPSNSTTGTSRSPCQGSVTGIAYCYDLAGNQTFYANGINSPSYLGGKNSLTFTNTYDGAGHLNTVISNWSGSAGTYPTTLLSAQTGQTMPCPNAFSSPYAPFGGLANANFGNGLTFNRAYDKRLRTNCENDTGIITTAGTPGSATVTITGEERRN